MYAKVFAQMYDGTLCTRGPWQALVTFQQMLVLADQDGNLDMTAEAISRRTTIPLDLIQTGIVELLKPDDESRTPTLEGRRIVPLVDGRSWGWHIVNYKHYRELKREEDRRDYHRKYWAEKRSTTAKIKRAQQRSTASTKSTEAEAKAEAVNTAAFASFYEAYPKKQKRKEAETAWKRLKAADQQAAMAALPNFVNSPDWAKDDGKFIPYPASWINGRRWEDLMDAPAGAAVSHLSQFVSRRVGA